MAKDTLGSIKGAFDTWRRQKRYPRERMPEALLRRARRVAEVYGIGEVARHINIGPRYLKSSNDNPKNKMPRHVVSKSQNKPKKRSPKFSQIEVPAPLFTPQPIVEVETSLGIKIRLFALTSETIGLVSSFCRMGR